MDTLRTAVIAIRDFFLTIPVFLLGLAIWVLPWRAATRMGQFCGYCAFLFWPAARRVSAINLRRAYGSNMDYAKARRWTREVFGNLGQTIAEGLQFARRFKSGEAEWEHLCEVTDPGLESFLLRDLRPKVFVMGHLGSWEITAMILALRIGTKGAAIIRRADNPFLNWLIRRLRLQAKSQWIEKRGAVAESIRRLQQGNSIAVLLDENGGWHGPFVQFFGRAASTRKTAALLSLTTGAPIVIGAAIRKPVSKKFLFKLALIEPSQYDRRPESIRQMTEEIVRIYEQWIREYPLQWRWIHWRWKNRPGGQEETYTWRDLQECFSLRTP